MTCNDINIRDPFVLYENGLYFMYGTRAADFGVKTGGFDVYISSDMVEWSAPLQCFDSAAYGMNEGVNWAPEVHKYKNEYYMFATFTQENGLRGTYILKSSCPAGEFKPFSEGAVTPKGWESLDGTLYVDEAGTPFLVFCHEHTQIIDGAVCCLQLSEDLSRAVSEPVTLFHASEPFWVGKEEITPDKHFITDGPFMYKTSLGELFMLWSTFIHGKYSVCNAHFESGRIEPNPNQLMPMIMSDGGHGMIFKSDKGMFLTFHLPNKTGDERPRFIKLRDVGTVVMAEG